MSIVEVGRYGQNHTYGPRNPFIWEALKAELIIAGKVDKTA